MEQRHRDALRRNLSLIAEDVDPHDLMTELPILSRSAKETVEAQYRLYGAKRASSVLVDEIQRKGPTAFYCFLVALWKTRKFHVVDVILGTLTEAEARTFKADLNEKYGERAKYERHILPTPTGNQFPFQEFSASSAGMPLTNNTSQPQNSCGPRQDSAAPLNDLPYGYTKRIINGLNTLDGPDLEVLKTHITQLSRGEAKKIKDGGDLFDVLADKNVTHGQLMSLLNDANLYGKVFRTPARPSSASESSGFSGDVGPPLGGNRAGGPDRVADRGPDAAPAAACKDYPSGLPPSDDNLDGLPSRHMEADSLRKARQQLEKDHPSGLPPSDDNLDGLPSRHMEADNLRKTQQGFENMNIAETPTRDGGPGREISLANNRVRGELTVSFPATP